MVAGHAFSRCRLLTFNITERRAVESQVPYMHIWPLANVRGRRSHTLLLTLLQPCTAHSVTKHSVAKHLANVWPNYNSFWDEWLNLFFFFLLVIMKNILQKKHCWKMLQFNNSKSDTTTVVSWSSFWLPVFLNIIALRNRFKAKQRGDFTVSSMCLRKDVHTLEDTTNTASRPVTQCRWPGSACTQPWNNNCCLAFDVSLGSGCRWCSG